MLVIDKEWFNNKAFGFTKHVIKYMSDNGFYGEIFKENILHVPCESVTTEIDLSKIPYIFTGTNRKSTDIKVDYLSNYTEKEPEEVTLEIDPNEKINYQEIEKEFSEDETDYSDFETEIAGKEKERFDMLELDEEG